MLTTHLEDRVMVQLPLGCITTVTSLIQDSSSAVDVDSVCVNGDAEVKNQLVPVRGNV